MRKCNSRPGQRPDTSRRRRRGSRGGHDGKRRPLWASRANGWTNRQGKARPACPPRQSHCCCCAERQRCPEGPMDGPSVVDAMRSFASPRASPLAPIRVNTVASMASCAARIERSPASPRLCGRPPPLHRAISGDARSPLLELHDQLDRQLPHHEAHGPRSVDNLRRARPVLVCGQWRRTRQRRWGKIG